jgi:hypothetical protein
MNKMMIKTMTNIVIKIMILTRAAVMIIEIRKRSMQMYR